SKTRIYIVFYSIPNCCIFAVMSYKNEDTIVALATAQGISAIAVIRLSGGNAFSITQKAFQGKNLEAQSTHTVHFGNFRDGERIIDEVLVTLFKAPHSFTKENSV